MYVLIHLPNVTNFIYGARGGEFGRMGSV